MFKSRSLITGGAFLALSLNGATFAFVGTSLPAMRAFMEIDLERTGLFTAALQAGFTLSSLVGGLLSDLMRRDRVLMLGCLILGSGSLLLGAWRSFPLNLALILCMGFGAGFIISSSNSLLVELHPDRQGTILNVHHVFFGTGSLLGPLIMGYLMSGPHRWQTAYIGMAGILMVLFLFFSLTEIPDRPGRSPKIFGSQVGELLTDRHYIMIITISALSIGTQFALMLLSVTFMNEAKAVSIATAGVVLSLFFVFLVLGRLICSRLAQFISNTRMMMMLLFCQSAALLAAWQGNSRVTMVSVVISGLACSGIYPGLLALTGALYLRIAGSALGILTTTAGLGGMMICWLTGVVSHWTDIATGFIVLVICSLLSLLIFLLNYKTLCRKEASGTSC